jgi:hypothetical protein
MTPDQLAIGQTLELANNAEFRNNVKRISNDELEATWYDQPTNEETLKVLLHVNGSAKLVHLDKAYWSIQINGRAATERDVEDLLSRTNSIRFSAHPGERRLEVTL